VRQALLRHRAKQGSLPHGSGSLLVTFDTKENFPTEYLSFEVADLKSSCHAILGRPMC
jgi:hypothetical protein